MLWLLDGEKILNRVNEGDRQTDKQTPHDGIGRACIASRGNNHPILMKFGTQQQI